MFLIKKISVLTQKKKRIELEGSIQFSLYNKEVNRYKLEEGACIEEEAYEELVREVLLPRAKKRSMHLLTARDYTKGQIRQKLRNDYPDEVLEEVLVWLESYHYLDDERYARNYIGYRSGKKSRRQLVEELYAKGISREEASKAYDELCEGQEEEAIAAAVRKKFPDISETTEEQRYKLFQSLCRKGFPLEKVRKSLKV